MVQTTAKAIRKASQSTRRNKGGTGPRWAGGGGPFGAAGFSAGLSGVVFFVVVFCVFTKNVLSRFCSSSQAEGRFTSGVIQTLPYVPIDTRRGKFVLKNGAGSKVFWFELAEIA